MSSAAPATGVHEDRVRRLQQAVFQGDGLTAARLYEDILGYRERFILKASIQFELARLLERCGERALSLAAYEKIALLMPRHPAAPACLLAAGGIAAKLKKTSTARKYLEDYLATDPSAPQRARAEELLEGLPDGMGIPDVTVHPSYDAFRRLSGEVRLPSPDAGETPDAIYTRLRDQHFAVVLPPGKRVASDEVAAVIREVEHLTEEEASAAVVERKGIVFNDLVLEDVFEVWLKTEGRRDHLLFVAVTRDLQPLEQYDVTGYDVHGRGLGLSTPDGPRRLRWEDARLLSAGRLDRRHTLDVYTKEPTRRFRFQAGLTHFPAGDDLESRAFNDAFREFTGHVQDCAPDAVHSFTLDKFMADDHAKPQKFASHAEFDSYNLWLFMGSFAERIDVEALIAEAQVNDEW